MGIKRSMARNSGRVGSDFRSPSDRRGGFSRFPRDSIAGQSLLPESDSISGRLLHGESGCRRRFTRLGMACLSERDRRTRVCATHTAGSTVACGDEQPHGSRCDLQARSELKKKGPRKLGVPVFERISEQSSEPCNRQRSPARRNRCACPSTKHTASLPQWCCQCNHP